MREHLIQVFDRSGYLESQHLRVYGDLDVYTADQSERERVFPIASYRGRWYRLHVNLPRYMIWLWDEVHRQQALDIIAWDISHRRVMSILRARQERGTYPQEGFEWSPIHPQKPMPNPDEEEAAIENYRTFHGVDPDEFLDMNIWVPGEMVVVGVGKDVGYGILNKYSNKDGWYVHDFGPKVKIYRRAKSGERADRTWSSFPRAVTSMGFNLGFTYLKGGVDGPMKEVKGAKNKYLAFTPSRRTIVVVGPSGIEYLMEGGDMRVDNWIRD